MTIALHVQDAEILPRIFDLAHASPDLRAFEGAVLALFARRQDDSAVTRTLYAALSPREREIAGYVVRGLQNREIAAALGTSPNTIRNQLAQLYQKLQVGGRTELASALARAELA